MISTMSTVCVNCKTPYEQSQLYCAQCGCILPHVVSNDAISTNFINGQQNRAVDLRWGTGYFHHRARLFLRVVATEHIIPVPLYSPSAVLGRSVPGSAVDIDLTPFKAADLGVSRRHIRIDRLRDTLQATDLGSSNGSFLNRDKLMVDTPRTLRNRAVLQLGDLVLRIQFA
jgi:transcription initiation factor TFIIIB Brf1 subunit/transcription initiation factor TFIIB